MPLPVTLLIASATIERVVWIIALLTVGVNFVVDWFLHKTSGLKE